MVVKAYQDEMKDLPFFPKGYFRCSVVRADGFFLGYCFWTMKKVWNSYKSVDS